MGTFVQNITETKLTAGKTTNEKCKIAKIQYKELSYTYTEKKKRKRGRKKKEERISIAILKEYT